MEDEAPVKRSVAQLAERFKCSAAVVPSGVKPVRMRPRILQLPCPTHTHGDENPQGATSPLPAQTKRNSALIEKLQARLPPPRSPGFKLPPSFTPPSPLGAATMVTTVTPGSVEAVAVATVPLQSEQEAPASFEVPPTTREGAVLLSINKARARLSLRRRPPSRRHRSSSSGEDGGGATGEDMPLLSPDDHQVFNEPPNEVEGAEGGAGGGGGGAGEREGEGAGAGGGKGEGAGAGGGAGEAAGSSPAEEETAREEQLTGEGDDCKSSSQRSEG